MPRRHLTAELKVTADSISFCSRSARCTHRHVAAATTTTIGHRTDEIKKMSKDGVGAKTSSSRVNEFRSENGTISDVVRRWVITFYGAAMCKMPSPPGYEDAAQRADADSTNTVDMGPIKAGVYLSTYFFISLFIYWYEYLFIYILLSSDRSLADGEGIMKRRDDRTKS